MLYPIGRGLIGLHRPASACACKARQLANRPALKRLGTRVRRLRQDRGLSQEALADVAKVGRSYMSRIERGVRNCSTLHLVRLAKALDVSVSELFSE